MTRSGDRGRATLRLLGPVTLAVGGSTVAISTLERGLLARAALTRTVTAAGLEPWLWGDEPPASAPNRIQALVSGIRRKCADAEVSPLVTEGGGYRLASEVEVDLDRHEAARSRARVLAAAGSADALDAFREALAPFADEPLQGIPATTAVEIERDRLEQDRLALWEEHADAALELGRADAVLADLAGLTARHPYREVLLAQHVLALAATGQQEQALRLYRDTHRRLDEELGVEPSARLRDAHARVLAGGTGQTAAAPPPATLPVPRTLPRRAPGFVGREAELAALEAAAREAEHRAVVVHLTGLTGMGKSALAVEAGQRLRDLFPDGTLYLDAARDRGRTTTGAVAASFLRLLGVHPDAVPDGTEDRTALFRSLLDDRRVLVVLDDVDAADGGHPGDLAALLPAGPGSMAVVTSRYPVPGLGPDHRLPVGSLDDDAALALLRSALGPDRVASDADGAAELVRTVGGMPLALRLVAARAAQRPDLGLARVAAKVAAAQPGERRLDGLDALAGGLALAWERLPGPARDLAARVATLPTSTFSGWVSGALLDDEDAGDVALDALLGASLVEPVVRTDRAAQYRLHDVVTRLVVPPDASPTGTADGLVRVAEELLARALEPARVHPNRFVPLPGPPGLPAPAALGRPTTATERAASRGFFATEVALARALARGLAGVRPGLAWRLLVVTAGPHLSSPTEGDWLAAVDVVAERLGDEDDDRLGSAHLALCRAWQLQSRGSSSAAARELADRARRRLTLLGAHEAAAAAGVVCALSSLSLGRRADAEDDLALAEASLAQADDPVLAGWVAVTRGTIHNDYDELPDAAREFTRAREVLAGTPARAAFGQATLELSRACRRRGALGPADVLIDEALADLDSEAESHVHAWALDARAEVSVALGRGAEALEQADRACLRARQSRDAFLTARSRRARAGALRLLGRLDEAERELRTSVEELTALGRSLSAAASLRELAVVLDLRSRPDDAADARRRERAARAAAQLAARDEDDPPHGGITRGR